MQPLSMYLAFDTFGIVVYHSACCCYFLQGDTTCSMGHRHLTIPEVSNAKDTDRGFSAGMEGLPEIRANGEVSIIPFIDSLYLDYKFPLTKLL